ncbi:MAG: hypothetical protein ABTQ32_17900 [Myxococcaceae bacterium]
MSSRRLVFVLLCVFEACTCVDVTKVTSFRCDEGDVCSDGRRCCSDGVCRQACAEGDGGATAGGAATAGGSAGGAAGGSPGCQNNQPCAGNTGAPCLSGVTFCQAGTPSCIDGPAVSGVACGNNLICRNGNCVTCTEGVTCSSNADPCREGETVCGSDAGCVDTTRQKPAGSPCGVGRVCTTAGQCITCSEGAICSGNPSNPCVQGVVRCASGSAVCVDGPAAPSGLACGVDRVCLNGNCLQCAANTPCASNPGAPCKRGVTTCGATPACVDGANAPAGSACGVDQVCSNQGTCLSCVAGASCSTNADSCRRGVVQCSTGSAVCVDDALKPAGSSCGADQVCTSTGMCVACGAGGSCTTNPSPCRAGLFSCATGTQVCVDGAPKAAGTSCGAAQSCDANGFCGACVAGASCSSNPGAPCKSGIIDCSTGSTRCLDSTNVTAGTACGPDRVCTSAGSCIACVAGSSCTTNPNPGCRTGITACTTGAQTCVDSGNRAAGTSCGMNQVCSPGGNCVTCVANSACTTNPTSSCRNGITSCTTGSSQCVDGTNRAAGTTCGAGQVCDANGNCGACVAGQTCTSNAGAPCRTGLTSCSSGSTQCDDASNAAAGLSCGAGQVCNGLGACIACSAGSTCGTNPGLCRNGVTDCATGALRCVDGGNKAPGTTCGSGQVCDSAGACVNCAAGSACTPTNPCFNGSIACTSGSPVCANGSRRGTGATCGTNQVCNALDQCVSCTQGASCATNPASACRAGTIECSSGAPVCVDGAPKTNGTVCSGGVCNAGSCIACNDGASCTTNPGAACRNGLISCASGSAVCVDGSNKMNGTTCPSGVCSAGACVACNAGASCTTNPNAACRNGTISCTTGSAVCIDGTAKANGTTCAGGVCNAGFCSACTQGAGCTSNPSSTCRNGTIDCATGSAVCIDGSNKGNGTSCPGGVCNAGSCNPCSGGASCTTNSNQACQNGVIDCSSGAGVCVNASNKMNGTSCPGGVCSGGSCNSCSQGASCSPSNVCRTGTIDCSSGSGVCVESGNVGTGSACPGGVCNAGACVACVSGQACSGNPNVCRSGVIDCASGGPVCVDGAAGANLLACPGGRCVSGNCCTGCVANPSTTPSCAGGFLVTACGADGLNCRVCPTCSSGRIRTCDLGECFCEF